MMSMGRQGDIYVQKIHILHLNFKPLVTILIDVWFVPFKVNIRATQ
jgi:hypothetical protein